MADQRVLIDTSIIISFLRSNQKTETKFWELINNYDCYISVITLFELYAGATTDNKKSDLDRLIGFLKVVDFTNDMALKASKIYRNLKQQNKLVEFRDLFIAASAIQVHIPLSTTNKKHFQRIDDIVIL